MIKYTIRKDIEISDLGQVGVKWEDLDKEYIKTDREVPMLYLMAFPGYDDMAVFKDTSKDEYILLPESYMKSSTPSPSTETLSNLIAAQTALNGIAAHKEDMKNYHIKLDVVEDGIKVMLQPNKEDI